MSTAIKLKKSGISGRVPNNASLEYGEVALNYADGIIYFKDTNNTIRSISGNSIGVDSAAVTSLIDSDYIQSRVTKSFINSLDVNAGTLDGLDGTYFLNYDNFFNTPILPDSAFVSGIASQTTSPADSASIRNVVDSAFINGIVNQGYVATIVDSQYIALRVGDFANNFGTAAVVGALSIDANTGGDTLTFAAGDGVNITTNIASKKITISAIAGQGLDFGSILGPVGFSLDMGAI
jgi:hypothetical protein